MNDPDPIACTLSESALRHRLNEIAALGAESLLGHEETGEGHVLRFRRDDGIRRQLEEIAAAEARCCSFLSFSVSERDGSLMLTIAAAEAGEPVAQALALAFIERKRE